MGDDGVDRPHGVHLLGVVGPAEGEDLPGELLAHLAGEVGGAEAAVEGADVGVGLLEAGVLGAGQGHVADDVKGVAAAGRPAVDDGDDELGHEADEPLALQDVEPPGPGGVDRLGRLDRWRTGSRSCPGCAGRRRSRRPGRRPWDWGRSR